jgi:hypothetical protein
MEFTPSSLPLAVAGLFRLNGYAVTGPVNKYGGEVDLVAVRSADLFPDPIYLEVTIEHVDNEKYAAAPRMRISAGPPSATALNSFTASTATP